MTKLLLFILAVLFSIESISQATLFSETFEFGSTGWTASGDLGENNWETSTCAGNGGSSAGASSMYVSPIGGTVAGCGLGQIQQFAHANSPAATVHSLIIRHTVNATCATSLQLAFDYSIDGVIGQDFAEVVYSTNGGFTWIPVGSALTSSTVWASSTVSLPALLNGTSFDLGFRFTFNDATISGNPLAFDNVVVTGADATPPVATCPNDTTVYVDNNCNGVLPDYTSFVTGTDNCTSSLNITFSQSPAPGLIVNGAIVVTPIIMTATDESGNSSTCTFDMRTIDTISTAITCPPDMNVFVGTDCMAMLGNYTTSAIIVDNCALVSNLSVSQSPAIGTLVNTNQVITITVTGGVPSGSETCMFNAWVIDTIKPGIICPTGVPQYVNNSCSATLMDFTGGSAVTENCSGSVMVTQSPVAGTLLGLSSLVTITLTVADSSGNVDMCQLFVPVIDTISPSISCPANQVEPANASCLATLGNYTSLASVNDNCSALGAITVTQSPFPGTTFSGSQVVTLTATDESSNSSSCTFTVGISDPINPSINCPGNQFFGTTVACDYSLTDLTNLATGNDNCTPVGSLVYSQSPTVGTLLPLGTHVITLSNQDLAGNVSSCAFNLTVIDATNPIFITCPSTQTAILNASCSATLGDYTGIASVSDNCSSGLGITLTQSPIAGTSITSPTLVTLLATDQAGNQSTCLLSVIPTDTTSPVLVCPANQVMSIDASCGYLVPNLVGLVGGSDNCSSLTNMTISQNPSTGSASNGITPVLITLTDENGNATTCETALIPNDIGAPSIVCPANATASAGTSCDFALTNFGSLVNVTDNCSSYTLSQSPAVGSMVSVGTNPITITVTDAGGNTASCTFPLMVTETVSPVINCPSDITSCDPVVFYPLPTFTDNCGAELVQTDLTGFTVGSTFPVGLTILNYEAIDTSGNSQGCSFRIEILDYPSPAIIALDTIEICGTSTALVEANPISQGSGLWTVTSGQGNFNNQFANLTGVNNINFGVNQYSWTVSTVQCGSVSDSVIVIRYEPPFATSIAADSIFSCSDSTVNLIATMATTGAGIWTVSPQATLTDPLSNTTSANMNANGWYEFTWTVTNGTCPSSSDSVFVFYSAGQTNATSSDSAICIEVGAVQLSADALLLGQSASWHFISGSGSIADPNASQTTVTNLQSGINTLVYEVTSDVCPTQSDTVRISVSVCDGFDPVFPTVITPNFDGSNDLFVIDYLELIYPNCHVTIFNRWGSVVYESIGYADPWDGTFNNEPLPLGTYFYRLELNDADGRVYSGDISIIR